MTPLDSIRAECYAVEAAASAALADGGSMMIRPVDDVWEWRSDMWEYRRGDWLIELKPPDDGRGEWSAYMVDDDREGMPETMYGAHGRTADRAMCHLASCAREGTPRAVAFINAARSALPSAHCLSDSASACAAGEAAAALSELCHGAAEARGWWDNPREVGTLLMLAVSELAEAMEAHRKGLQDQHLPLRPGIEVELADALIRICDMVGGLGLDIGGAVRDKMMYNASRADHDPVVRAQAGGKAY